MNKSIRPWIQRVIVPALVLAMITLLIAGCTTPGGGGEKPPSTPLSTAKAMTAFSFAGPSATGTIDENTKTIAVTVPYGTDVTALVATFTTTGASVKVGSTDQVSGTTVNNFSSPVIYTVTAADGSTVNYTVTVTVALASAKAITAFSFASPASTGVIDENAKTIAVTVPYGTDVTALAATFTTTGSSVKVGSTVQVSGVTLNNFTSPVIYMVTAADASTASYTVTVAIQPSGSAQWARTVTTATNASIFWGTAVDSSGNVYAAGYVSAGTFAFGNGVTAAGSHSCDAVLVKYDSSGDALWARSVTGDGESYFSKTAVDSSANVYAVGNVGSGTYAFGSGVTTTGTGGAVLVKYDSSGSVLWVRSADAQFFSTAVDAGGNVYAAGWIYGTGTHTFGNGVTAAGAYGGGWNVLLVKYDSSGTALWARSVTTGIYYSEFSSVAVDSSGNVYAAGDIAGTGTYTFGNGVTTAGSSEITSPQPWNAVLVRYDASGTAVWARSVSTGHGSSFFSTAVDSGGNVYAAGWVYALETYTFGNGATITGAHTNNVALVRYDSSGNALWARTEDSGSQFSSIAFDSSGNIYAASDGYLVKYDSSGATLWSQMAACFSGTAVDSSGNVYAVGNIGGTDSYAFGNGVTAAGAFSFGPNAVLVKYSR